MSALIAAFLLAGPSDLNALALTSNVLSHVKDELADPARVRPAEMFHGAVRELASEFPELKIALGADDTLTVGKLTVPAAKIDSLPKLFAQLKDVAQALTDAHPVFAKGHALPLEVALVNGLLATLDPNAQVGPRNDRPPKLAADSCRIELPQELTLVMPCRGKR